MTHYLIKKTYSLSKLQKQFVFNPPHAYANTRFTVIENSQTKLMAGVEYEEALLSVLERLKDGDYVHIANQSNNKERFIFYCKQWNVEL